MAVRVERISEERLCGFCSMVDEAGQKEVTPQEVSSTLRSALANGEAAIVVCTHHEPFLMDAAYKANLFWTSTNVGYVKGLLLSKNEKTVELQGEVLKAPEGVSAEEAAKQAAEADA